VTVARVRLTRDTLLDAVIRLMRDTDKPVTLQRLGRELGVDATAFYRHFRDKDELVRAAGDRMLADVMRGLPGGRRPRASIVEICVRLRAAHLRAPALAAAQRSGPPLTDAEFAITDGLLAALRAAGLAAKPAALGYHALIELTVGSAALDAHLARLDRGARTREYRRWRSVYATLDPDEFPNAVALAPYLYAGTADDRFRDALDRMLDGMNVG
jgi:AcrR family transcriptional regulator